MNIYQKADNKASLPFILVTGAAGFIGSHLIDRLLSDGYSVIGVDNFMRGDRRNLSQALSHPKFRLVELDLGNKSKSREILGPIMTQVNIDTVWHLAANASIQEGSLDPHIDLHNTFMTTFTILLLMKEFNVKRLVFSSTAAVYGNLGTEYLKEETGPLFPISHYGAMKLASEGLISSAIEEHLERAWICRFPNVVGSRRGYGVIFDLLKQLQHSSEELTVLGDGNQRKPYLHVSELIEAMMFIWLNARDKINCFNIGPEDIGTSVKQTAEEVIGVSGLGACSIRYTGGDCGWVGDVPRFSYNVDKLNKLGWRPRLTSEEAVRLACKEVAQELGFLATFCTTK
jgi:UDP-glucose 4-epimerase